MSNVRPPNWPRNVDIEAQLERLQLAVVNGKLGGRTAFATSLLHAAGTYRLTDRQRAALVGLIGTG